MSLHVASSWGASTQAAELNKFCYSQGPFAGSGNTIFFEK